MNEFNVEIVEKQNDVTYDVARVEFPAYEEYKEKAFAVAEYISGMDATTENIKDTKAALAKARKLTDRLNRVRIDMKKAILQNYSTFEGQVKEIVGIIDDADKELREKVKSLEEEERRSKKNEIYDLWLKRIPGYDYALLETVFPNPFESWIKPKHLNKTTSMKSIEADMTEWIHKRLEDINAAKAMGDDYLEALSWTEDLAKAIAEVHRREDALDTIHGLVDPDEEEPSQAFVVYGWDDISKAEDLLRRNNIKFITY